MILNCLLLLLPPPWIETGFISSFYGCMYSLSSILLPKKTHLILSIIDNIYAWRPEQVE